MTDAQTLRADPRRVLWDIAQEAPEGNTLVILDLLAPRSQRPLPFGALAGRSALRIDTTADQDTRARYVEELLERLGVKAEPRAIDELARSESSLAAVRNDLEKLALSGKKITFKELEREALSIEDPKPYQYAGAVAEGRIADAMAIAHEFFANESGPPFHYSRRWRTSAPTSGSWPVRTASFPRACVGKSELFGRSLAASASGARAPPSNVPSVDSKPSSPARSAAAPTKNARSSTASPSNYRD